jgi:hypothetical protein
MGQGLPSYVYVVRVLDSLTAKLCKRNQSCTRVDKSARLSDRAARLSRMPHVRTVAADRDCNIAGVTQKVR